MWVITLYADVSIKMFEFESEKEAREVYHSLQGNKYLSHLV
ncbi:hypothetical protein ACFPRA_00925 [Sporosarcina soli]|uniref:Uncharacterized protein n=1 Tax=Sporosarcina soli TaxID=334736 RepID=A0ABW0TDG2_9BACL